MEILYFITVLSLFVIGIVFKRKNIKDIKLFNLSILYLILIIFILTSLIVVFIVPAPSYYIKPYDEIYIEKIIINEMRKSNIDFDEASFKTIDCFLGEYNQLYLCKYENNGIEEVRMFDFKRNIFGNLKPAHDFKESRIISKEEIDSGRNYRIIRDGLSRYFISYGYNNNPNRLNNIKIKDFKIGSIDPEGYYLIVQKSQSKSNMYYLAILIVAMFLSSKNKKNDRRETYKVVKNKGKKINILEIEYYA